MSDWTLERVEAELAEASRWKPGFQRVAPDKWTSVLRALAGALSEIAQLTDKLNEARKLLATRVEANRLSEANEEIIQLQKKAAKQLKNAQKKQDERQKYVEDTIQEAYRRYPNDAEGMGIFLHVALCAKSRPATPEEIEELKKRGII